MATPTFCNDCDRTVYVADGDDFACPVCSTPLPDTRSVFDAESAGVLSEYYLG